MYISNVRISNFLDIELEVINEHFHCHLITYLNEASEIDLVAQYAENLVELRSIILPAFEVQA